MAVNMSPTQEVTIDGDNVFIKNSLGADVKFTIGQAFEHESPTGEKFQVGHILHMRRANERRRYIVTSSLTGWAHAQTYPCICYSQI